MKIDKNTIIGEIVASNYKTASVFSKHQIDYCCNGNRSIAMVCDEHKLEIADLIHQLETHNTEEQDGEDFHTWEIDQFSDYIYNKHHKYVESKLPEIQQYLQKLCEVHGESHPELFEINSLFSEGARDLAEHMKKEERDLFPYFRQLAKAARGESTHSPTSFGSVQETISAMHHEHDNEGERYRKISSLSNNYTPPEDACTTYKVAYVMLVEFEKDLHKHIHLENNILFNKAIRIESQLNQG